jgi:hypothetical protein
MTIGNGTAIVLAYVLVSIGLIIAFLLAAFVMDGSSIGCASAAAESAEKSNLPCHAPPGCPVVECWPAQGG